MVYDKNHNPRKGTETKSKSSRHVFGIQMIRTIIPARGRKLVESFQCIGKVIN